MLCQVYDVNDTPLWWPAGLEYSGACLKAPRPQLQLLYSRLTRHNARRRTDLEVVWQARRDAQL